MQNKQFPFSLLLLGVVSISVMAGLVVFVQHTKTPPHGPALVPTQQVNGKNAIGGKPVASSSATRSESPSATTNSTTSAAETHDAKTVAPRQQAITETISKNYPYRALGVVPDDPFYASSWLLQHTNAAGAWGISTGSQVVVAIIDTGFALNHEDLTTQWETNSGETGSTINGDPCWTGVSQNKSSNGCDDDSNGYVDDWRGWNFVNTTNNPQAGTTSANGIDAISHGTSVAGLAGAATNNHLGIASYNWSTKLMPLTALDDSGSGNTSSVVAAVYYAVDNGASVINLSLGGPDEDPALQTAIDYAYSHNVVVVAAAGNCGTTGDAGCGGLPAPTMMYPAKENHVIAVGATDNADTRASFSSYGPALDVVAPGSGTLVSPLIDSRTAPYNYTNAYSGSLYGTSFASPIVTGIVSLIRSQRPASSVDDITGLIDGSATKVTRMNGLAYTDEYGHGLVNASTAVTIANALASSSSATPKLAQTGDYRSEHSFSSTATMSSGCTVAAGSYCTIHVINSLGYDRYLPYSKTSASGTTGWQWSGAVLGSGEWTVRAMQGDLSSTTPYYLFSK
jgi:subtilisin family serine protease